MIKGDLLKEKLTGLKEAAGRLSGRCRSFYGSLSPEEGQLFRIAVPVGLGCLILTAGLLFCGGSSLGAVRASAGGPPPAEVCGVKELKLPKHPKRARTGDPFGGLTEKAEPVSHAADGRRPAVKLKLTGLATSPEGVKAIIESGQKSVLLGPGETKQGITLTEVSEDGRQAAVSVGGIIYRLELGR